MNNTPAEAMSDFSQTVMDSDKNHLPSCPSGGSMALWWMSWVQGPERLGLTAALMCNLKVSNLNSLSLIYKNEHHGICEDTIKYSNYNLAWKILWTEEPGGLHTVHGVAKSWTWLNNFTFTFHFHALEKEMATHFKCSCLENPRDGGSWWAAVYGVAESDMTEVT